MKYVTGKFTGDVLSEMSNNELQSSIKIYRDRIKRPALSDKERKELEVELCYMLREMQQRNRLEKCFRDNRDRR